MKKQLLLLLCLTASFGLFSQTVAFTEDFETGGGGFDLNSSAEGGVSMDVGLNQWIVNGIYGGGAFTDASCSFSDVAVNPVPAQPAGISSAGGQYMHIYSDLAAFSGGGTNCNYMTSDGGSCSSAQTHFAEMSSDISTIGKTNVTLNFWWLCDGNAFAYGELYYSTDGAATWTQVGPAAGALDEYRDVLTWTEESVTSTDFDGHAQLRFGFRFVINDDFGGYENMLAFGIDDVEITTEDGGTACVDTYNAFTVDECFQYTVPSGDTTYAEAGVHTAQDTIANAAGCDSILTITINITDINTDVTYPTTTSLKSEESEVGATYQWTECPGYTLISGETSQTYMPSAGGNYAVIVSNGACVDTSDCYIVDMFGLDENEFDVSVYPNPAIENFTIDLGQYFGSIKINVVDLSGRIMLSENYTNSNTLQISVPGLAEGIYSIEILLDGEVSMTRKIIIR